MNLRYRVLVVASIMGCAPGAAPGIHNDVQNDGVERAVALVTGDQVTVAPNALPRIRPAPGRERVSFVTMQDGEHTYVIPHDAVPRLAAGELDRAQFDVAQQTGLAPHNVLRGAATPRPRAEVDAPIYALTLRVTDRAGHPDFSVVGLRDRATREHTFLFIDGEVTLPLQAGRYSLTSSQSDAVLGYPSLTLDRDMTIELDGRLGAPIAPVVPGVELTVDSNVAVIYGDTSTAFYSPSPVYIAQLGPDVSPDELRSIVVFTGTAKGSSPDNPVHYTMAKLERGRVPAGWQERIPRGAFASIDMRHISDANTLVEREMSPWLDDAGFRGGIGAGRYAYGTHARSTEYVYGPGLLWLPRLAVTLLPDGWFPSRKLDGVRDYRPGHHYTERWNHAPYGPSFSNLWGEAATRSGDGITLAVSQYSDATSRSSRDMARVATETDHGELYRDGVLVADDTDIDGQVFIEAKVASEPATYRFETHATCGVEPETGAQAFDLSTKIDAAWTFVSSWTSEAEILPLPTLRFRPALDDDNRAGRVLVLPVEVQRLAGAKQVPIASIAVEISYDDGATWTKVAGAKLGDRWLGIVVHRPGARYASLRGIARDIDGRTNEVTIIHAYRL